jgi:hypothetical protein
VLDLRDLDFLDFFLPDLRRFLSQSLLEELPSSPPSGSARGASLDLCVFAVLATLPVSLSLPFPRP